MRHNNIGFHREIENYPRTINLSAELQIREGTEDNSKIIFLISNVNISCDPSLEPSQ